MGDELPSSSSTLGSESEFSPTPPAKFFRKHFGRTHVSRTSEDPVAPAEPQPTDSLERTSLSEAATAGAAADSARRAPAPPSEPQNGSFRRLHVGRIGEVPVAPAQPQPTDSL